MKNIILFIISFTYLLSLSIFCNKNKDVDYYNNEIESNPTDAELYYQRGILLEEKDLQKAIENYSNAINLKHEKIDMIYRKRGSAYLKLGDLVNARKDLDMSIILYPTNSKAFSERGTLNKIEKKYSNAIEDFEVALKLNDELVGCYNQIGMCYYESGLLDMKSNLLLSALDKFNKSRINFLEYEKKIEVIKGSEELTRELLKNEDLKDLYYYDLLIQIGKVLSETGDKKGAIKTWNEVIEMNEVYKDTCNSLINKLNVD